MLTSLSSEEAVMQRKVGSIVVGVLALGAVSAFAAGKRTAWGDPDLRGTYTTDNSIGVPLERPAQFGTRAELTDEEYAARVSANDVQVAKDKNPLPESEFAEDSAASFSPSGVSAGIRPSAGSTISEVACEGLAGRSSQ